MYIVESSMMVANAILIPQLHDLQIFWQKYILYILLKIIHDGLQ